MNNPRIEDWAIEGGGSPYDPPELRSFYLKGKMYGHHIFGDGKSIRTSSIVAVNGIIVTTHSGSVYQLGKPNDSYVEWCRQNDHHVPTPEEPIKLL